MWHTSWLEKQLSPDSESLLVSKVENFYWLRCLRPCKSFWTCQGLGFYQFPTLPSNRKEKWIIVVRWKDWRPSKHFRVYRYHFVSGMLNQYVHVLLTGTIHKLLGKGLATLAWRHNVHTVLCIGGRFWSLRLILGCDSRGYSMAAYCDQC